MIMCYLFYLRHLKLIIKNHLFFELKDTSKKVALDKNARIERELRHSTRIQGKDAFPSIQENQEILRSDRIRTKITNLNFPSPKTNKLIETLKTSSRSLHMGHVYKNSYCTDWFKSIFSCCGKMHNKGTLSRPFLRVKLPPNTLILHLRLAFEGRTTDLDPFFEFKVRFCADGTKNNRRSSF